MRKLSLTVLALAAGVSFASADGVRYVYWTDQDTTRHELTANSIDCQGLTVGMHYVHFQAFDSEGLPTPVRSRSFMVFAESFTECVGQNYWFDSDTARHALDGNAVDCSDLRPGMHYLHVQAADRNGAPIPPQTRSFLVLSENAVSPNMKYWFDTDTAMHVLDGTSIDCSGMKMGVHYIHFQPYDNNGMAIPSKSRSFIVLMDAETPVYEKTWYWFDQEPIRQEYTGGAIDCSSLGTGMHTVHFQTLDTAGHASPTITQSFLVLVEDMNQTSDYSRIEYWYDNMPDRHELESGILDCSTLMMGLHTVHFQIIDTGGKAGPAMSQTFVRINDAFNGDRLCYWFDEQTDRSLLEPTDTVIDISGLSNGNHTVHFMIANQWGQIIGTESMTATFTVVCPEEEHIDEDGDGHCDVCGEIPAGIHDIMKSDDPAFGYDLHGIRVPSGTKGIMIINGRKYLNR